MSIQKIFKQYSLLVRSCRYTFFFKLELVGCLSTILVVFTSWNIQRVWLHKWTTDIGHIIFLVDIAYTLVVSNNSGHWISVSIGLRLCVCSSSYWIRQKVVPVLISAQQANNTPYIISGYLTYLARDAAFKILMMNGMKFVMNIYQSKN